MTRFCSARFIQDFLFTDNNHHKEFLKRIQRLDKDDGILLVNLLERVATGDGITPLARVQRLGGFDPQDYSGNDSEMEEDDAPYTTMVDSKATTTGSSNAAVVACGSMSLQGGLDFSKHPLRIAEAYVGAKNMAKHDLNIYEVAYLNPLRRHFAVAITCFIVQWGLLAVLIYYDIFDQKAAVTYSKEDAHILLSFVAFGSSIVFLHKFLLEGGKCIQFAQTYRKMTPPQHRRNVRQNFPLALDFGVNVILGLCIFLFNIYFVLISDDANEAILNALALFFILELDDDLTPDMDDDEVEDMKAVKLLRHVLRPLTGDESLTVKKFVGGNDTPTTGPGCYSDDDVMYIQVDEGDVKGNDTKTVTVWKADGVGLHGLTTNFNAVRYVVGGSQAGEFCEALADFRCTQNWKDISQ